MASQNPNIFKRAYENLMGTPEQNKKAREEMKDYPPEQKFQKMIGKGKKEESMETTEEPVKKRNGGKVKAPANVKKMAFGGLTRIPAAVARAVASEAPRQSPPGRMGIGNAISGAARNAIAEQVARQEAGKMGPRIGRMLGGFGRGMKEGGTVKKSSNSKPSSKTMASRRGDGCAIRGKTKAGIK